jgi:hypothetical protein
VRSGGPLVGLKYEVFGRARPDDEPVDRDFSDVAMLLQYLSAQITTELAEASQMRWRAQRAGRLADEDGAVAAARELHRSGQYASRREAEIAVRRAARAFLDRMQQSPPVVSDT